MKLGMCLVLLAAFMTVMLSSVVSADQSTSCMNVLISMAPCLDYITGNSSSPSQHCCDQFANVVRSSPECLCEVLKGGGSQLRINFNKAQALALPKACNVQTPPASRCNGDSSDNSHAGSSNTSEHGNGSKTVPGDSSSDANPIKFSFFLLLAILKTASYITIYSKY